MKGLAEVRRQLLESYPSKQDVTENEWLDDLRRWAEQAKEKLESMTPPPRKTTRKPPPEKVKSLTPDEIKTIRSLVLRCTDISQLSDVRKLLSVHMWPLVHHVRSLARLKTRDRKRS